MNSSGSLDMQYGPPTGNNENLLGTVCYGTFLPTLPTTTCLHIPLECLGSNSPHWIRWISGQTVKTGTCGHITFRHDEQVLLGYLSMEESDSHVPDVSSLAQYGHAAYSQIFETLRQQKFPYLVRCWNYLPNINAPSEELERYRQFNIGRQAAFLDSPHAWQENAPAANALGSSQGAPCIYFLASRIRPHVLDNPRQTAPWRYPQQYGPRSPIFSRGTLLPLPDSDILFISGTASILGHKSMHIGNVVAQTEETLRNLCAVLDEANRTESGTPFYPEQLALKIFVRDADNWMVVRDIITREWGKLSHPLLFLRADICRSDLLVEIEAYSHHHRREKE